jgi:Ca-activated chloride channel homolog
MIFRYPIALALIPAVLWLLYRAMRLRGANKVLHFPLAHREVALGTRMQLPVWLPFCLRAAAFALALMALARPQTSTSQTKRNSEGIDIMITLDVSKSMTTEDVGEEGKSRIEAAKDTIHRFIAGRHDDRIGFSIFSGDSITLCPPTLDYDFLHSAVDMADVNMLKDGTAIGDGLATAVNRLKDSNAKSRIVVLATDGDNNMGAIAPLTAGEVAAGYGIKVYTIAMGSEGIVNVPDGRNIFGQKVYHQEESTINPELLVKISELTGGKFYRALDSSALHRIFGEIDKLERTRVERKERVLWDEHFQPFLLLALLFFAADLILRSTKFRILPE